MINLYSELLLPFVTIFTVNVSNYCYISLYFVCLKNAEIKSNVKCKQNNSKALLHENHTVISQVTCLVANQNLALGDYGCV